MTTGRFEGYVCHILVPTLRPGQIVVADNLTAHHSDRARAAIEARGTPFWHLPPYSPDFTLASRSRMEVTQTLHGMALFQAAIGSPIHVAKAVSVASGGF